MGEVREVTELITLFEDQGLVVSAAAEDGAVRVSGRDAVGRVTAAGVIRPG